MLNQRASVLCTEHFAHHDKRGHWGVFRQTRKVFEAYRSPRSLIDAGNGEKSLITGVVASRPC